MSTLVILMILRLFSSAVFRCSYRSESRWLWRAMSANSSHRACSLWEACEIAVPYPPRRTCALLFLAGTEGDLRNAAAEKKVKDKRQKPLWINVSTAPDRCAHTLESSTATRGWKCLYGTLQTEAAGRGVSVGSTTASGNFPKTAASLTPRRFYPFRFRAETSH
jgi:hypothetical protein